MPIINIAVAGKIATNTTPGEVIVCGNSDYTLNFTFDSEWEKHTERTARFVYTKDGLSIYQDVEFTGTEVPVPVLSNIDSVMVGVFAGDLYTTTPARIWCDRSILCFGGNEELPPLGKEELQGIIATTKTAAKNAAASEQAAGESAAAAEKAQAQAEKAQAQAEKAAAAAAADLETLHGIAGEDAPAIVCEATGAVVSVADASNRVLHGLRICGKTTQNGTPTPENPVELVSVGASGAINTTVAGGNLHNPNTWHDGGGNLTSLSVSADGYVTFPSHTVNNNYYNMRCYVPKGTYTVNTETSDRVEVYVDKDGMTYSNYLNGSKTVTLDNVVNLVRILVVVGPNAPNNIRFTINAGTVALPYEEYKGQTLTASTPNGLPGIPVSSGGNYKENGQHWICDEIDFARGVYVQRIEVKEYDGSNDEFWFVSGSTHIHTYYIQNNAASKITGLPMMCDHFIAKACSYTELADGEITAYQDHFNVYPGQNWIYVRDDSSADASAFKNRLSINPITVMYILATPIETPLTEEELTAYAALHTNKPNTTVYNDAGAGMAVEYVADTKNYIDQKLAAISAALLNA